MTQGQSAQHQVSCLLEHVELSKAGWRNRSLDQLVLGSLWLHGGPATLDQLGAILHEQFVPQVLDATLTERVEELRSRGAVVVLPDGRMRLSQAASREQASRVESAEALTDQAEERFRDSCRRACPNLDASDVWRNFNDEFLVPLVKNIGARTYDLILGHPTKPDWSGVLDAFTSHFPQDEAKTLRTAVMEFLNPDDRIAREYVLRCLNAYLLMQASTLSEESLTGLAATAKPEFTLFLDTNFVFSLLDLHENPANEAVHAVQGVLGSLEGQVTAALYVLPPTIEEARGVLVASEKVLGRLKVASNIAEAGLQTDVSGIAASYLEAVRSGRVRSGAKAYFDRYTQNLVHLLRDHGVELFNCPTEQLKRRQEVIDDVLAQEAYESAKRGVRAKAYERHMHDVVLWHFVRDKRPTLAESPAEAKYWIVTVDMRFLGFDAYKTASGRGELPVCLHPTTLLQLLQFWVPRSEAFERAVLGSMRLPFLFSEFDEGSEKVTVDILAAMSRLDGVEKLPVSTLRSMLLNEALRTRIAHSTALEEQVQAVRDALAAQYATLQVENTDSQKALQEERERGTKLEGDLTEVRSQLIEARENAGQLAEQLKAVSSVVKGMETGSADRARREGYRAYALWWCTAPLVLVLGATAAGTVLLCTRFGWQPLRVVLLHLGILSSIWLVLAERSGRSKSAIAQSKLLRVVRRGRQGVLFLAAAVVAELVIRLLFG